MIRRTVVPLLRAGSQPATISTRVIIPRHSFMTSAPVLNTASSSALPQRKPVGAFRGGLFGFLFGSVVAGASVYYYILEEYRVSNELLTEDIYALQTASQRLNGYITELETKIDELQKKKK